MLHSAISSGVTTRPRQNVTGVLVHYAETHNDIAQYLKGIENPDDVLPDLLDWQPDGSNNLPLFCAVRKW